jgi:hypothetical protein
MMMIAADARWKQIYIRVTPLDLVVTLTDSIRPLTLLL